jgi:hypothetical protein
MGLRVGDRIRLLRVPDGDIRQRERERREQTDVLAEMPLPEVE